MRPADAGRAARRRSRARSGREASNRPNTCCCRQRAAGSLQPGEQPLQRPVRRRPPARRARCAAPARRSAPGSPASAPLPAPAPRPASWGWPAAGRGPARRTRGQVIPFPPVDALIRHLDLAARPARDGSWRQARAPAAPLRGRQLRADHLLDQRVPEQRDLPRPFQPPPLICFLLKLPLPVLLASTRGRGRSPGDSQRPPLNERGTRVERPRPPSPAPARSRSMTAAAISHGDTASSRGHRPAAATAAAATATPRIGQRRPGRLQRHRVRAHRRRHPGEDLPNQPRPARRPGAASRAPCPPGPPAPAATRRRPCPRAAAAAPPRSPSASSIRRSQQPRGQQHMRHQAHRAPGTGAAPPPCPSGPARTPSASGHDPTGPAVPRTPGQRRPPSSSIRSTRAASLPTVSTGAPSHPHGALPVLRQKSSRGGPSRNRHAHGVVAHHTPNKNTGKTSPLSLNDAKQHSGAHAERRGTDARRASGRRSGTPSRGPGTVYIDTSSSSGWLVS